VSDMPAVFTPAGMEFVPFPKVPRFSRPVVITEKIDGTNSQVGIDEQGNVFAGSRNRWLTPEADNFGFAKWVREHEEELRTLGPGRHFGEWWGAGIQRRYGLTEKRFSLFHSGRVPTTDAVVPACCSIVPVLYEGPMSEEAVTAAVEALRSKGSRAAPGFDKPEGVVIYHLAAGQLFKKLLEKDELPKGAAHE